MFTEKKRKSRSRLSQFFSFFPSIQTCSTVFQRFTWKIFHCSLLYIWWKNFTGCCKQFTKKKICFNKYISVRGLVWRFVLMQVTWSEVCFNTGRKLLWLYSEYIFKDLASDKL